MTLSDGRSMTRGLPIDFLCKLPLSGKTCTVLVSFLVDLKSIVSILLVFVAISS